MSAIRTVALALILSATGSVLHAQEKAPKRPRLESDADTNSAGAYYQYGMQHIRNNSRDAANAFYWASRLDPAWADPLYARRVAMLMSDHTTLLDYLFQKSYIFKSKQIQHIDSLYVLAMLRDPFVNRALDHTMLQTAMLEIDEDLTDLSDPHLSPEFRAWVAYTNAQLPRSAALYADAIRRTRRISSCTWTARSRCS